jgi:hypothetical protein
MLPKDVPIILVYTVPAFPSSDGSKFKRTVDECIKMCDVMSFPKGQKIMAFGIVVRCVRWTDKVCVCG